MITSRTKKQLIAFLIITLLGVSFVGARYAKLNRLLYSTSYDVNAHFVQSGGIFTGAEVTYRGVSVGQVSSMKLVPGGVDVVLAINNGENQIPSNTAAIVGDLSAVGEQYVDLEPRTNSGPYLKNGSVITSRNTSGPVPTVTLLTNLNNLINSVPKGSLRTAVTSLGEGFKGTGPALGQIIDTSGSFIRTAEANFSTTTALLRDSNVVLKTQVVKAGAIRAFSRDLALFTGTVAGHDKDLRALIVNGAATSNELRTFLQDNQVPLGQLINNLVTNGQVVISHLNGIRQILVLYPYVVAGGFTVAAKGPTGYDAHFGLILQQNPSACNNGYQSTNRRTPYNRGNTPMNTRAHCAESPSTSNARGAQNAPNGRPGASYRVPFRPRARASQAGPTIATYHVGSGRLQWTNGLAGTQRIAPNGGAQLFGKAGSWKWLLLQPVLTGGR